MVGSCCFYPFNLERQQPRTHTACRALHSITTSHTISYWQPVHYLPGKHVRTPNYDCKKRQTTIVIELSACACSTCVSLKTVALYPQKTENTRINSQQTALLMYYECKPHNIGQWKSCFSVYLSRCPKQTSVMCYANFRLMRTHPVHITPALSRPPPRRGGLGRAHPHPHRQICQRQQIYKHYRQK